MAAIIPLRQVDATPREPAQIGKDFVVKAYEKLAKLPGFKVRDQQVQLSQEVRAALVDNEPLLAEAPTGTGKTLAYLIGALAAREQMLAAGIKDYPVVISTATKGLQQQVLTGDLPTLERAGVVLPGSAALAKGRANYLCERAARDCATGDDDSQMELLDTTGKKNQSAGSVAGVQAMLDVLGRTFDGDLANWPSKVPLGWNLVNAQTNACLGRNCDYHDSCALVKSRARIGCADIIVANHDLVLRDLLMVKGGLDGVLPRRFLLVFDEGHHVPGKAADAASVDLELHRLHQDILTALPVMHNAWRGPMGSRLLNKGLAQAEFSPATLLQRLEELSAAIAAQPGRDDEGVLRFPRGVLPPSVMQAAQSALAVASALEERVDECSEVLRSAPPTQRDEMARSLGLVQRVSGLLHPAVRALSVFCAEERAVRWTCVEKGHCSLSAAPLDACEILDELLWSNHDRVRSVFVSATLRDDQSSFARFRARLGVPSAREYVLKSPFPYRDSTFITVVTNSSARHDDRAAFAQELKELIPEYLVEGTGNLVLFQSTQLMEQVMLSVRAAYPGVVRVQGQGSFQELIASHKADIDAGNGAVLMGVATMAEGLDLPGRYCENLIITQLPFTVPSSPIEKELAEELGRNAHFAERSKPDAFVRLTQMVGRLLRRETDRGRIVMLDKRMLTERWGRDMLLALPMFHKRAAKPEDKRGTKPASKAGLRLVPVK